MQKKTLLRRALLAILMLATAASAGARNKYLFVYFTGNSPEQEQISYAISDDGFNNQPGEPASRQPPVFLAF